MGLLGDIFGFVGQKKNRTPLFEHTFSGNYLEKIMEQGRYSPKTIATLLSRIGRQSGTVASGRAADIQGQLVARGMDNSIAGLSLIDAPKRQHQRTMADAAERFNLTNEESKVAAEETLVHGKDASRAQRRGENMQRWNTLGGAADQLVNTAMNLASSGVFGGGLQDITIAGRTGENPEELQMLQGAYLRSLLGDVEGTKAILGKLGF